MRAYSMDLRERILRDSDAGMKASAGAVTYHVSASWVRRLTHRRRATGEVAPRQQRYGRRPVRAPQGRGESSTFIAALRVTGLTAPGVLDGPMDGASFLADVEQILVPTFQPGDIVIADTLAAHTVEEVHAAMAAAGATRRFCRPPAPTSTPSSSASPHSKRLSVRPAVAPSTRSGPSWVRVCRA